MVTMRRIEKLVRPDEGDPHSTGKPKGPLWVHEGDVCEIDVCGIAATICRTPMPRPAPGAERDRLKRVLLGRMGVPMRDLAVERFIRGPWGKPFLGRGRASVSFSAGMGSYWGCVGRGAEVGLDVTVPDEFREGYPYERAFGIRELEKAQRRISGGAACAAALIWAGKEAAVKALGCGFHLVDPRSVEITHISPMVGGRALLRATIPLRRKSTHVETACVVYESPEGYMCIATYVGVNRAQSENAIYESNGI